MSRFTMAQIVTLTGIKAHTLRKWETRYSFLEPERTETNIRYYSDMQLKKLLNVSVLTRNGFRISKIDKMSESEINDTIAYHLIDSKQEDEISALVLSMLEMDEVKFDEIIKSQIIKNGLFATITNLIYPFLNQVGVLWGINKVLPAHEHFMSNLIRQKILSTIDLLPKPDKSAPSILMFLPEGEFHEIGLLIAHYIAKQLGWRVYYLGSSVPIKNIKQVVDYIKPKAMLTMFVSPSKVGFETQIENIFEQGNLPLFVSGNPMVVKNIERDNLFYLSKPDDLIISLNNLK